MRVKPSMALVAGLVLVLVAGAAAWLYRDSPALRALARLTREAAGPLGMDVPVTTAGSLHKCVQGPKVLYTDAACPSGSRAESVTGGAITIVPGVRAAATAASIPNARDLLAPKVGPSIRDQQMERAIEDLGK
jgi:hypothetical protein